MKQQSNKHFGSLLGVLVVGLWLALLGYYFGMKYMVVSKPSAPAEVVAISGDQEVWMGLYLGQRKIGYNHMLLRPLDSGYRVLDEVMFQIKLMDQSRKIHLRVQADLSDNFTLRTLNLEGLEGIANFSARGRVEGNAIVLDARMGGEDAIHQVIPFSEPPVLYTPWLLTEQLKLKGLEVGQEIRLSSFEAMTRQTHQVELYVEALETLVIAGKEVQAYKVREVMAGQEDHLWVSIDGQLLKQSHPSGFIALRETREQAVSGGWDEQGAVDLIAALVVKANTAIIDPRKVGYLRARLKNISLSGLDLTSDGQQAQRGLVTVERASGLPGRGYALPISQDILAEYPELEKYLEAELTIQKDHPAIIKAAELAAGDMDATAAAGALVVWVSDVVDDSMVLTLPSALSVLEQRKGACKEHTVLYVALARAVGLPARMISGMVYAGNEQLIEGFYYHAWPEVWLAGSKGQGGRWIAVDPTFNQFPADATHIRLKEGGLDQALDLLGVIGQVEVEVEEYR